MVALGVLLHAIGGFAAGTFYLPLKKLKNWSWESGWMVNGVFSWIIAPLFVAWLMVPDLMGILREAPARSVMWAYLFGVLWGIGGLTFGLSMRYLGMSLGYAVALGFCAIFGTLVPPVWAGKFGEIVAHSSGWVLLGGIAVCIAGIATCGAAGMAKEREMTVEHKQATIAEFNFPKGILIALFAGVMSACMSFAFEAGDPIAKLAVQRGVPDLWQNTPVLVVILLGGFTTNFLWCIFLNAKNKSGGDYAKRDAPLAKNYLLAAMAGVMWYLQFMFYGMGTTKMGAYNFSSWTLHMAFIIVFSNVWGLYLHEWKGSSPRTIRTVVTGIVIVFASTLVIGVSNYLGVLEKAVEK
jgi:L-rhamnose-H+ transport protein